LSNFIERLFGRDDESKIGRDDESKIAQQEKYYSDLLGVDVHYKPLSWAQSTDTVGKFTISYIQHEASCEMSCISCWIDILSLLHGNKDIFCYTLFHEFTHYLDYTIRGVHAFESSNVNKVFDTEDSSLYIDELQGMENFLKDKNFENIPFHVDGNKIFVTIRTVKQTDVHELVADLGGILYTFPKDTQEVFPLSSERILMLIDEGYFGDIPKPGQKTINSILT
jgi:hypothetical protein